MGKCAGAVLTRLALPALVVTMLAVSAGCVQRTLLIESDPQGAPVWLDETYVGRTPQRVPFTFYGTRKLQVGPIRSGEIEIPVTDEAPETALKAAGQPGPSPKPDAPVQEVVGRKLIYEKQVRLVEVDAPWWDTFPIDFVTNVLIPYPFRYEKPVHVKLQPSDAGTTEEAETAEEIFQRAGTFREHARSVTPEELPPLE